MRRVSGEEGKKSQGQEISQTLTWSLLMQLISIATLLSADTMSSIDVAKVTQCIWCSLRLETRTWQDNHNTWWMIWMSCNAWMCSFLNSLTLFCWINRGCYAQKHCKTSLVRYQTTQGLNIHNWLDKLQNSFHPRHFYSYSWWLQTAGGKTATDQEWTNWVQLARNNRRRPHTSEMHRTYMSAAPVQSITLCQLHKTSPDFLSSQLRLTTWNFVPVIRT